MYDERKARLTGRVELNFDLTWAIQAQDLPPLEIEPLPRVLPL